MTAPGSSGRSAALLLVLLSVCLVRLIPGERVHCDPDSGREQHKTEQRKDNRAEFKGNREKGHAGTDVSECPEEEPHAEAL